MLETSKDLLFVILAFCVLIFTAFMCWLLYYCIAIIRDAYKITKSIHRKIELVDDILKTIKEKINSTASYVGLIFNSVEKLVSYLQNRKASGSPGKKTRGKMGE